MSRKQIRRMEEALSKFEPQLRDAFLRIAADIKSSAQIAVIARALEEGRVEDAVRMLAVGPEFWAPLDDAIRAAYLLGGRNALASLPVIPDPAGLGKP